LSVLSNAMTTSFLHNSLKHRETYIRVFTFTLSRYQTNQSCSDDQRHACLHLVSSLNVAVVMAHSAYGGVDMLMMFSCQEYKSVRGWRAISHMLALIILSLSDVIITLTSSVFMSSVRLGVFCNTGIKCMCLCSMILAHVSVSLTIIPQDVSPCVLQNIQAAHYTFAVFLQLRRTYN
jgi:hypothetical protein